MMTETIDLPEDVLACAAQWFFAAEWASAREAAGFRFRPATEITNVCPRQDTAKLLNLVRTHVARLADDWGMCVRDMFRQMELPRDRWADALYYVLMACRGHGIGLADDYSRNIEIARRKLGKDIDPAPYHDDFLDFYFLASEVVEADARTPEHDADPNAPFHHGDRVRVDSRMPTGDRVTGTGTVLRWFDGGETLDPAKGVVVALDDGEAVEPWCYRGMAVFVPQGEFQEIG